MKQKRAWILCLMVASAWTGYGRAAALPDPAATPAAAPTDKASGDASNSVVKVFATVLRPDPARPWTKQAPAEVTGSGAIIEGDRILTNAHVVLYASQVEIQANRAGDKLLASVLAVAPGIDLVRQLSGAYPEYFIYGPLVFSRATLEHLQSVYSPAMFARPRSIYGMFQSPLFQQLGLAPSAEREEVVIVSSPFFPDKLTAGYDNPAGGTVARLNGKSVRGLKHLVELLRDMKDEFMVIEFDQPEREALVFARQQLVAATERILTNNDVRAQGSADMMRVWQGR